MCDAGCDLPHSVRRPGVDPGGGIEPVGAGAARPRALSSCLFSVRPGVLPAPPRASLIDGLRGELEAKALAAAQHCARQAARGAAQPQGDPRSLRRRSPRRWPCSRLCAAEAEEAFTAFLDAAPRFRQRRGAAAECPPRRACADDEHATKRPNAALRHLANRSLPRRNLQHNCAVVPNLEIGQSGSAGPIGKFCLTLAAAALRPRPGLASAAQ